MKVKRYKKVNKYLNFYRTNYGFHSPYQVLIDGTFCQRALKYKVNLKEQLPKYLGDQVKMYTTMCIINEVQNIGRSVYGAFLIVKQFDVRKCGHSKNPLTAAQCIRSTIGKNNPDHFIVATSDLVLTDQLRAIPGCPLLYLKMNTMNLEKPSQASVESGQEIKKKQVGSDEQEMERLKVLKQEILGHKDGELKLKKKKGPKGPNPLSVKKKKPKTHNEETSKPKKEEKEQEKRKRKRLKIPKNRKIVQKVLDSFGTIDSEEN